VKKISKVIIFLAVILAITFVAINYFSRVKKADRQVDVLEGQILPNFTLKDLEGNTVNSANFMGKSPTLLLLWATWCPHCRSAIKELNEIASPLEKKGAKIITIDLGEKKELVSSYMKEHKYNLIVLLDEDSSLSDSYGIIGVPTFFLLGKDGRVKSRDYSIPEDYEKTLFQE
jgi:thiol-disulfide isomerase/thioredoxin